MADRITDKDLKNLCDTLNTVTGNPLQPYSTKPGESHHTANPGNFHVSYAYGGAQLHQMANEGGGVRSVLSTGYTTKRKLWDAMHCYLAGLEETHRA